MRWRRPLSSFVAAVVTSSSSRGPSAAGPHQACIGSGAATHRGSSRSMATTAAAAAASGTASGASSVIIAQPEAFQRKKAKFVAEGASKLQMLFDWDYTCTSFTVNGKRGSSCHKVLEDCDLLPEEYHTQAQALQQTYYPKEIDPSIPMPEKIKYMEDWVHKAHDLLLRYGFLRSLLPTAVQHANVAIRDGIEDVLTLSERADVPFLIFSAGIADVIEEVCRQQLPHRPLPSNVHIVSNRMLFAGEEAGGGDGNGGGSSDKLTGFTEPVFHVFNKRIASVLATASYCHETDYEQRHNVLLVGDSLGDLHMSDGLAFEEILRVGFLNDRVEERLEEYKARFDVVILGDPDASYVVELLREIVGGGQEG